MIWWVTWLQVLPSGPPTGTPSSAPLQWYWWIVIVLGSAVVLYLFIRASNRVSTDNANKTTIESLQKAVAARDIAVLDGIKAQQALQAHLVEVKKDLEEMTIEMTALAGINIKERLAFEKLGMHMTLVEKNEEIRVLSESVTLLERRLRLAEGDHG